MKVKSTKVRKKNKTKRIETKIQEVIREHMRIYLFRRNLNVRVITINKSSFLIKFVLCR